MSFLLSITQILSLLMSLSLTHTIFPCLPLSFTFSLYHLPTHLNIPSHLRPLMLPLSFTNTYSLCVSLPYTHSHAITHKFWHYFKTCCLVLWQNCFSMQFHQCLVFKWQFLVYSFISVISVILPSLWMASVNDKCFSFFSLLVPAIIFTRFAFPLCHQASPFHSPFHSRILSRISL